MQFELSTEQKMIVDTVRSFVENELYPHEDEVERLDAVPPALVQSIQAKAIEVGLYAANMPAELGGGAGALGDTASDVRMGDGPVGRKGGPCGVDEARHDYAAEIQHE